MLVELTETEIELIEKHRDGYKGIYWHPNDFEMKAMNQLNPTIYDKSKYEDALDHMLRHHDCNNGITWDTISFYLDEYCKKE